MSTMKKTVYSAIIFLAGIFCLSSCMKVYHCSCTYNNTVMLNKELGKLTYSKATTACNAYDTTVAGENWTCTVY